MIDGETQSNGSPRRSRQLRAILDSNTSWYKKWYFELRLEEEIARAIRHHLSLSILVILLPQKVERRRDRQLLNVLLSDIAARKLRRSDLPGLFNRGEYAVLLTHTTKQQAEVVAERLREAFLP